MNDFNWDNDETVVFPTANAVAVFMNEDGGVVIRQQDPMGDDDPFVVIPPAQLKALIKALRNFQV